MKILLINSVCGIKSTGRICVDIAQEYEKKGYEAKIAYGRGTVPGLCEKYAIRIGSNFTTAFHAIQCRIFDNEGFSAKAQTKRFLKWAEEFNPDVVWLHNLHGYYINVDLLFRWIKSRPNMKVRWTLHDCWAFTGHCTHFDYVKCTKWTESCSGHCPMKSEYPKSSIISRSGCNYIKKKEAFTGIKNLEIITPSKWLSDLVKKSFLKEYPVKVIHTKIDTGIFKPTKSDFRKKYGLEKKIILLGVTADWEPKKGLDDFIRLSEMVDDRFKVVMVGLTPKQIKKMPNSIIAIARTHNATELAEIYTASDYFINLTYEDNYPTVNLEAQACGTECITYNTGGSPESVDSKNVVPTGDLKAVYDLILQKLM